MMSNNPIIYIAHTAKTIREINRGVDSEKTLTELKSFSEEQFVLKYLNSMNECKTLISLFRMDSTGKVEKLKVEFDGHLKLVAEPSTEQEETKGCLLRDNLKLNLKNY